MSVSFLLAFFVLGTIIGSFLNVVILRYGARKFGGRSQCVSCGKRLHFLELIPVASFLIQRGRCRGCGGRISLQYPLVELLTGLVFAAVAWKHLQPMVYNLEPELPFLWWSVVGVELLLWSLLIAISVYDFRHKVILDSFVFMALVAALFLFVVRILMNAGDASWLDFLGGFFFAIPFALLWFFSSGRWIGLGDAKLILLFSWIAGFAKGLSALIIGFWIGAAAALLALSLKALSRALPRGILAAYRGRLENLTFKTEVPLGPFLVLGLFIVYLLGVDVTGLTTLLSAGL